MFADPTGTQPTGAVIANLPFYLYVVADGLNELKAYEFSVQYPTTYFALATTPLPEATGADFASDAPGFVHVQAGTGLACVTDPTTMLPGFTYEPGVFPMFRIQFFGGAPAPNDAFCAMTLQNGNNSIAAPAVGLCDDATILGLGAMTTDPNGNYADACFIANPTFDGPVGAEDNSFGSLKARY